MTSSSSSRGGDTDDVLGVTASSLVKSLSSWPAELPMMLSMVKPAPRGLLVVLETDNGVRGDKVGGEMGARGSPPIMGKGKGGGLSVTDVGDKDKMLLQGEERGGIGGGGGGGTLGGKESKSGVPRGNGGGGCRKGGGGMPGGGPDTWVARFW